MDSPQLQGAIAMASVCAILSYFVGFSTEVVIAGSLIVLLLSFLNTIFNGDAYPGIFLHHLAIAIHFGFVAVGTYYIFEFFLLDMLDGLLFDLDWISDTYFTVIKSSIVAIAYVVVYLCVVWSAEYIHRSAEKAEFFDRIFENEELSSYFLGDDDRYPDGYHVIQKSIYFKLSRGVTENWWALDSEELERSIESEELETTYRFNLISDNDQLETDSSDDIWLGALTISTKSLELSGPGGETDFFSQFETSNGDWSVLLGSDPTWDKVRKAKRSFLENGGVVQWEGRSFIHLNFEINEDQFQSIIFTDKEFLYMVSVRIWKFGDGASQILNSFYNLKVRGWRSMGELIIRASEKG